MSEAVLNANLATKSDIERVEKAIKTVKADMTKWLLGAMPAQTTIILAFVAMLLGALA